MQIKFLWHNRMTYIMNINGTQYCNTAINLNTTALEKPWKMQTRNNEAMEITIIILVDGTGIGSQNASLIIIFFFGAQIEDVFQ